MQLEETRVVYSKFKSLAKSDHENVSVQAYQEFGFEGRDALESMMGQHHFPWILYRFQWSIAADLKADMGSYLDSLKRTKVRSPKELVNWNFSHWEEALTTGTSSNEPSDSAAHQKTEYSNKNLLVSGLTLGDSNKKRRRILEHIQKIGQQFEDTLTRYDIDIIDAPSDSGLCQFSAARGKNPTIADSSRRLIYIGFPIATLPMSYLDYDGRPSGLTIAAPAHKEALLLNAWEDTFPARKPPSAFQEAVEERKTANES